MTITTTLEHVIDIDAAADVVYEMWTTPHGLCAWWGVAASIDPRPGGVIRVDLDGEHIMLGEFVSLEPPNRVLFTFGWEGGELAPGSSTVEVLITPTSDGASRLTLRHSGLPMALLESHAQGWTHFLGRQPESTGGLR
jgi:uncharacterized protein YndB with AHSA1/START domain